MVGEGGGGEGGCFLPWSPMSPMACHRLTSLGKLLFRSMSAALGASSWAAQLLTVSRKSAMASASSSLRCCACVCCCRVSNDPQGEVPRDRGRPLASFASMVLSFRGPSMTWTGICQYSYAEFAESAKHASHAEAKRSCATNGEFVLLRWEGDSLRSLHSTAEVSQYCIRYEKI